MICTVFYINIYIFISGWWLNQPIWKICSSNWKSSPNRGEHKKCLKPPPRYILCIIDSKLFDTQMLQISNKNPLKCCFGLPISITSFIQFPFLRGKQCPTQVHHVRIWPIEPRKNPPTFHYTGWLIGILIMVYKNPYIAGQYNPLYTLSNQGFFIAQLHMI